MTTWGDDYIRAVTDWEVIDGDTFRCRVELGFYITAYLSCRLIGINAPDHGEQGREEAKQKLFELLSLGAVTVHSIKADKYAGRFDAVVLVTPPGGYPAIVNQLMIEQGYAVAWDGTGKRPPVPWPPAPKAGA